MKDLFKKPPHYFWTTETIQYRYIMDYINEWHRSNGFSQLIYEQIPVENKDKSYNYTSLSQHFGYPLTPYDSKIKICPYRPDRAPRSSNNMTFIESFDDMGTCPNTID